MISDAEHDLGCRTGGASCCQLPPNAGRQRRRRRASQVRDQRERVHRHHPGDRYGPRMDPAVTTTVAGLAILFPSPVEGQTAYVTDAVSCVFGASVTGGGINVPGCPVHWDGAAWVAG